MERLPAEGQMAYMREAIPLLEQDESIEMYAWCLGTFSEQTKIQVPASESSQDETGTVQLETCD